MKIRKNDTVKVMAGKDKGKSGKVLRVIPKKNQIIAEGINFVKRHTRKSQKDQQGGIVQREAPINASNLMIVCTRCNKPTRIQITILSDGTKTRYCKKCEEIL